MLSCSKGDKWIQALQKCRLGAEVRNQGGEVVDIAFAQTALLCAVYMCWGCDSDQTYSNGGS